MGRLVDDLLFLTRAEADSLRFEFGPVPLQDVIEEARCGRPACWPAPSATSSSRAYPPAPLVVCGRPAAAEADGADRASTTPSSIRSPGSTVEVELRAEGR